MLRTTLHRPAAGRLDQRGLSMVEVLVGIAIGLVLVGGVLSLFATNLTNARRMLVEARVNQDLRVAADLIARDLRRASYWQNAISGTTVVTGATTPVRNPYRAVAADVAASQIDYTFSRDGTENDAIDGNERFGFRRNGTTIQMQTSQDTWQTVTDPTVMEILGLTIEPFSVDVDARASCAVTCVGAGCPVVTVRHYRLTLLARAASDTDVVRQLVSHVKVRNDSIAGTCPA
ncbi:MAG TPA: prepilin-type N-terminal cleavage/methylation domain-containing protein [Methylibium sp.]|nr:prepilin-type N-terminal cleavage/methylation domain-containing protein [Methylibium sp.]